MTVLIMANGEYGDLSWYRDRTAGYSFVICADGGTNAINDIGLKPDLVVGDMDSIDEGQRFRMKEQQIEFITVSKVKDFTDTQLALDTAEGRGYKEAVIWGGLGGRLDHAVANLFIAAPYVKRGMSIRFESPSQTVFIIKDQVTVKGKVGDTVSVLALEDSTGVTLTGFSYPLDNFDLKTFTSIGVSNLMDRTECMVRLAAGVLAIFHNH